MKYRFISEQRRFHRVEKMARALGVSRAGHYEWLRGHRSLRQSRDKELVERIKEVQKKVHSRYGSPRISQELARAGYQVGHNHVARLMREHDLGRRARRRYRCTTKSDHNLPVAKNLVNREFRVEAANRVWVSDITYVSTAQGWLYLCVVIDLYSRKVIGWAMSCRMKATLVVQALIMALMRRGWPREVIFHSDRGCQYASEAVRGRLTQYGLTQSMSRKGDCWDNAPSESFFSTLKTELCGSRAFATRAEAQAAIFEYIEIFYNRVRLHSTIGYLSPAEYEEGSPQKAG